MKKLFNFIFLISFFLISITGCHFIESFTEKENISLSLEKSKTSISMGAMEIINLTASSNQNEANISWSYDSSVIFAKTDNYSAVITGLQPGTTTLTAYCGSNSASCLITVSNDNYAVKITNPYVYASSDYVEVKPGKTVKISAALFGGTVADINGFSWTIDKSSVASLSTEGNYCWITGLNEGIAKVQVRHNKAAYAYSFLVNCSSDGTNLCYITTSENIITINLSESDTYDFAVDLKNPLISEYASGFTYTIVDSLGKELTARPIVVTGAGSLNVNLKAYETGEYYLRCSHPSALYDLDILIRVIENAETAYIEPSKTLLTVSDSSYEKILLSLQNYSGDVNPALYEWDFSEYADEYIDYEIADDKISIKGKKTGNVKITVSYPGLPSRNIIVLVRDIENEASDATCYITTSQNYIRMKSGGDAEKINITLKNVSQDEVNNLKWTITNKASDGSLNKVINWKTGNGNSVSRAVLGNSSSAYAIIEPLNPGTAYIDITHPKAIYSTRITVVVTDTKPEKETKTVLNYSSCSPIISIKNGEQYTLSISAQNVTNTDELEWTSSGNIKVAANGLEAVITSPVSGSGGSSSTVTVTHKNADYPLIFTVMCYDTYDDIKDYAVKSIYTYSSSETIKTGENVNLYLEFFGFENSTPSISWTVTEGTDVIDFYTENSNKTAIVTGLKKGKAIIKASCPDCDDVNFVITVNEYGIIDEEKYCYLSTSSNVIYFESINQLLSFDVELVNIDSSVYSKMECTLSNNSYDIVVNNNTVTLTSLSEESEATLTITHPLSENELVVYLKTGKQYEYINEDSVYISTNEDVFNLYAGQDEVSLIASLNHTESSDNASVSKGFTFSVEDSNIAEISYVNYSNICYIKPIKNGTTKIFVKHNDADFEKEVVVIVNQTPDVSKIPYITTSSNVITVVQGNYATANVSLVNSDSINNSLWKWESLDSRIADVIANNGTSAMICANSPGTVEIKVSHTECLYSLKILVTVLDSLVVTSHPYIYTSSNIITLKKGFSTTLSAQMIGGTDADSNYFRFNGSDSSKIFVNSVSGSAYVKALNTGMAYITVTNTRHSSSYSKTVLIVVEDTVQDGIYIKTSSNIIKIKPTEKSLTTISASLINGEATDGEDFIWWADDYNLIGLTSVAERCSIVPTGRSGTTKIHVKHAKASKQVDIIVMISDYDTFAFSSPSATINAESLYFFPLQVPSVEEDFTVEYSSTNEDVCIIQGSNNVAWVCGKDYGTASLTAAMVSKADKTVMASCEMLVTVTVKEPDLPIISLGNSILTVEAGTSKVISASINRENLESTEKYNLKWSVKNKDSGITLLDETADKTAYGSDVYVTFNAGGEYVLQCEHEESGAVAELYILVIEKGKVTIELNSAIETVYKDDGSFTLTATLTNATDSDYKSIEWSAIKVGGQAIVAVSKSKGATCTVTPKNVGQTTVIAKLQNGETARCVVIVKANTEISIDVGSVHVIPGYTEIINYKTNPENATINWYTQMTANSSSLTGSITNYFKIEDDTAKKQLRITGLKDYPNGAAGSITASMVGASSANLPTIKVYVEYNVELRLESMEGNNLTLLKNNKPDTANVKKFNVIYYPKDLDIDIKKGNQIIACVPSDSSSTVLNHTVKEIKEVSVGDVSKSVIIENGIEKMCMTVSIVPHTECSLDLSVEATLPGDSSGSYSETKSFVYSSYYDSYDIELVDLTTSGAFTKFTKDPKGQIDRLELSDGEEAIFYLKIKNENAAGKIKELKWNPKDDTKLDTVYHSYAKPGQLRADLAEKFFDIKGTDKIQTIETQKISPKQGLIYFYSENDTVENTTVYHLSHAWDYYKDLPSYVQGDKWKSYREEHNYDDNFISNLKKDGVDYWLVSAEMQYKGKYAIPHPGKDTFSATWDAGVENKTTGLAFSYMYEYCGWTNIYFDNDKIYSHKNGRFGNWDGIYYNSYPNSGSSGKKNNIFNKYTKTCIPYVITTNELENNNVLVRPNEKIKTFFDNTPWRGKVKTKTLSSEIFKITSGLNPTSGETDADKTIQYPKLTNMFISPTVCKDTSAKNLGSGTLSITYLDGQGNPKTQALDVSIKKRLCEAYTNQNWNKVNVSGKDHWYLSTKLFDESNTGSQMPFFILKNDNVFQTVSSMHTDEKSLYVDYEISPANSTITVTVPDSSLYLQSGSYSSKTGNTYTISQHSFSSNGVASGTLKFCSSSTSDYTGIVSVVVNGTNFSQTEEIAFNIQNNDITENPGTESSTYCYTVPSSYYMNVELE